MLTKIFIVLSFLSWIYAPSIAELKDYTFQSVENVSDCKNCKILANQDKHVCIMSPSENLKDDYLVTCTNSLLCTMTSYFSDGSTKARNLMTELKDCPLIHNPFREYNAIDDWGLNLPLVDKAFFVKRKPLTGYLPKQNSKSEMQQSDYLCELNKTAFTSKVINQSDISRRFDFGSNSNSNTCMTEYCNCNLTVINVVSIDIETLDKFRLTRLPNAVHLELVYRGIYEIEENAFEGVRNLKILNISHNDPWNMSSSVLQSLQELTVLNFSDNHLNGAVFNVLKYNPKLEVLALDFNEIIEICDHCLDNLHSLRVLSLRNNFIRKLYNAFAGVPNLEVLDLSYNHISSVEDTSLISLRHLRELNLKGNMLRICSSQLFIHTSKLEYLDLSENKLESMPELSHVSNLTTLYMEKNNLRNISSRTNEMLCTLRRLKSLNISNNIIYNIIPFAFNCSYQLSVLDIGKNLLKDLAPLQHANARSIAVNNNNITEFSFSNVSAAVIELNIGGNQIQKWIPHINNISNERYKIQTLSLKRNHLELLSDLQFPPTLKFVDLSYNNIQSISVSKLSKALQPTIDLRFNNISFVCKLLVDTLENENRPKFKLDFNPIKCSCEIEKLGHMYDEVLKLASNMKGNCSGLLTASDAEYINNHNFLITGHRLSCSSTPSTKVCQCNLYRDYVTKCGLSCPVSCACYLTGDFDYYLVNCTYRRLNFIPTMDYMPLLSFVDFSNNELTILNSSMLSSYTNVVELRLNENRLKDIEAGAFSNQEKLIILDLSNNLLETLPSHLFANNTNLEILYLAHNLLTYLPETLFLPLNKLTTLQLQNNSLKTFPLWILDKSESHILRKLNINYNPWSCECDYFKKVRVWLEQASVLIENIHELSCSLNVDDGFSKIHFISFNSSHCNENNTMLIQQNLPIWLSIIVLSLAILVSGVLMYLYRQEIQVMIYSRYGVRVFQSHQINDDDKHYDVFIAYCGDDEEFVVHEVLPGLEQIENPYRVCIHHRNFLAGSLITKNILEAVEQSCRTLVILSDNFTKSGWCRFEFLSAHNMSLCDRVSRLIVVILGDIPDDCDPEMKLYLKTNTYLQWGDRLFWKKLYFALPDPKANDPINNDPTENTG